MGRRLTQQEEIELFQRQKAGDRQAFERLVLENVGLAKYIAGRYERVCDMTFEDRVQCGILGLIQAVIRFDERKGNKFSTYAVWWVRQAINREINNRGFTIRLPVVLREKMGKARKAVDGDLKEVQLTSEEFERLSVEAGIKPERLKTAIASMKIVSLDYAMEGEGGDGWGGELIEYSHSPMSFSDPAKLILDRDMVQHLLACLSLREKAVIVLRFGLADGKERSLADIGPRLGVTRERIRQIEGRALCKMRQRAEEMGSGD